MLKIKLSRRGKRNQPSYRIVVQEAKAKRSGTVVETLGFYNPLQAHDHFRLNRDRFRHWLHQGAVPTETVGHLAKQTS